MNKIKFLVTVVLTISVGFAAAQSIFKRKTEWTVTEVKQWVEENRNYSTWRGWLLYRGSDSSKHYLISRINDEWVWFNIKRSELKILEEKNYNPASSSPFGYYYVDATKDFLKIKDY